MYKKIANFSYLKTIDTCRYFAIIIIEVTCACPSGWCAGFFIAKKLLAV